MRFLKSGGLLIYYCSAVIIVKAQGGPPPPGSGTFKPTDNFMTKMAEILPNAPNTAAIEKFGGVDIEMNTGVVKKSIQLKPFISKKITVPVSLGFSTLGLRVNEYPSRTGLGWNIVAGGLISRVIYGKDDLVAHPFPPNFPVIPNQDDPQTTTWAYNIHNGGNRDVTPDVFSYNFGPYSGKFIIDYYNNIVPVEVTNIKFYYDSLSNAAWTFKAVTPDGTEYLFGGPNAKETTKIGGTQNFFDYVPNAWHLLKITNQYGYSVNFVYTAYNYSSLPTGREQTLVKNDPYCTTPVCENQNVNGCVNPTDITSYMSAWVKMLTEINNGEGDKVEFLYSESGYPEKLINEIRYYHSNTISSKYVLDYDTTLNPSGGAYPIPILKNIKELGAQNGAISAGYKFGYYAQGLIPARLSLSQDHWGFANGHYNTTLIPTPEDPELAYKFPGATANRNPNPSYAIAGMLSSVEYPTGGKDSIEYEPNTKSETKDVNGYITYNQAIEGLQDLSYTFTADQYFSTGYDPAIQLTISCFYTVPNSPAPHPGGRVVITNTNTNQVVYDYYIAPPIPPATGQNTQVYFFNLPAGNYKVATGSQGMYVKTIGQLRKRDGLTPNYQTVQTVVGGMRVKRVITSDNSGGPDMIKRYYYGTIENKDQSSAPYYNKPKYYLPFTLHDGVPVGNCETWACNRIYYHETMYSSSQDRLYITDGKILEYSSVLESIGGDNFESGAIEHKFHIVQDYQPYIIRGPVADNISPASNNSIWSLGETETNIYKKTVGGLVKTQSKQNENIVDFRLGADMPFYFVSQVAQPPCVLQNAGIIVGPPEIHYLYGITRFQIAITWKYLKTERTITYDENGNNPVTTQVDYYYDDTVSLFPSRKVFVNSKGVTYTEYFKYPVHYPGVSPYPQMVSRNIVTPVIEQVSKITNANATVNNKELTRVNVNYGVHSGNNGYSFYEPTSIQKSKDGQALETEITINNYDIAGNILQSTTKSNITTSYMWGYGRTYPVAKVVGKSYAELLGTGIDENILNQFLPDNSMRLELDKLRILNNCFIQTFTYKHAAGMSSEKNVNGFLKYYEYDEFNRLVLIKDNESRILKKLCYKYNNVPEVCNTSGSGGGGCTNTTPDWQNTSTPLRCQQGTCGYNGYQEQEQMDMNPCSPGYLSATRWIQVGYNPSACPPGGGGGGEIITYSNTLPSSSSSGFTAVYTNNSTGLIYTFSVPSSGTGQLGCIPAGNYSLSISKSSGITLFTFFGNGCATQSGTSAFFASVTVGAPSFCNAVTLEPGYD